MRALWRKSLRDLWLMRGQAFAIALVMGCGVATFTMSLSTRQSLRVALDDYYATRRLADIFAVVKRAPLSLLGEIAALPGVAFAQARVVTEVSLEVADEPEPVSGRLISLPPNPSDGINSLSLREGRWPRPGQRGEAVVSEAFSDARKFRIGDRVSAIIQGRRQELHLVGIALSPEYVYEIRPGALFPDNKRFGILWMAREALAPAAGLDGAFNDVSLTLHRGASAPEVIRRLDGLLEPYGSTGAFGRRDQPSFRMTEDELSQMRIMALLPPSIFLSVAAFLLNMVLTRLIGTQREQIAMLKSFGYGGRAVAGHYLVMVAGIVIAAMVMGSAAGVWLGRELTRMYMEFFKIPGFQYQLPRWIPPGALLLCLSASLLGVTGAVRRAARLPPAEAMRPEAPANYGPSLLERLGLGRTLGMAARMVARNLERRPFRSIFAVIGIALATSVLVLGSFIRGTIEYVVDVQFQGAQRQDYTLTLTEAASDEGLSSLRHLPGIVQSEPVLAVPVRISAKHRERRITLTGVPADRKLYPLLDMDMHAARIVPGALVVSKPLAEAFGVGPGDPVQVEVLTGERKTFELKVGSLLNDFAGLSAYMEREELGRRIGQPDRWSAAFVRVDRSAERDFVRATHETPLIAAVSSKRAGLESFRRTFAENILRMRFFNVMFATIIACGVVYNTARIALSERSRELATLRVIGFNRREISTILLGEVGALVFAGLAPGMVLGYGFAALAVWFLATESQRFPLIVTPQTFAFAATVVLLAAIASGLWVRRGLDRLDLVAVLKARD